MAIACPSSVPGPLGQSFALDIFDMMLVKVCGIGCGANFVTDDSVKGEEKWQIRFYSRWITLNTR